MSLSKRSFLVGSGALAAFGAASLLQRRQGRAAGTPLARTPSGDLGPFYPVEKPIETDADLTRVAGLSGRAGGEIIEISGRVLARDGTPQANAGIELWQANAVGRYAHADDDRTDVPLDPAFQGHADLLADAQGHFRFLTVKPGLYPVGSGSFKRAPHIHFDVRGRRRRLITQMYFADTDAALLAQDKLLQHDMWGKPSLPPNIFAQLRKESSTREAGAAYYTFDVVL
jgi:protocatechuate 3,4-dioxygenase beta subunit